MSQVEIYRRLTPYGDGPVFIDEYQRVPEVLDAIKAELNRDLVPGRPRRSSTAVLRRPIALDTLNSRWPAGSRSRCIGRRLAGARSSWFADYLRLVIDRDVLDIRRIWQRGIPPRLLRRIVRDQGQGPRGQSTTRAKGL